MPAQGEAYLQWRRDLVKALAPLAGRRARAGCGSDNAAVLWDFAGFQSVATTAAPSVDETAVHPWHYETSHFNPKVGTAMFHRMTGLKISESVPAGPFGVLLTSETLLENLAAIETRRSYYLATGTDRCAMREIFARLTAAAPPRNASRRFYLTRQDFKQLDR